MTGRASEPLPEGDEGLSSGKGVPPALVALTLALLTLVILVLSLARGRIARVPEGPAPSEREATGAWARVLWERVDERGRVDFRGLARKPEDIELYLRWVAAADDSRMSHDERLAFHINAYNALAMYSVVRRGYPKDFDTLLGKIRFFYLPRHEVAGERISLYDLENEVIRPESDARVHQSLNCMAGGCPVLPRKPFTAGDLQSELDRQTRFFFNEDRNVRLDDERCVVHLTGLMDLYPEDYLSGSSGAPSLVDYVNRWREEPVPEGYEVEFIPYDWTVKSQA